MHFTSSNRPSTFEQLSKSAVESFLQTAVVLDDEAVMEPQSRVSNLVVPDAEVATRDPDDGGDSARPTNGRSGNKLDAEALVDAFASHAIVCGVLSRFDGNGGSPPMLAASGRADIVILDWHLDDEGQRATGIIRDILKQDQDRAGRLRLIAVYTAESTLSAIADSISSQFTGFERSEGPTGRPRLSGKHARIVFVRKGRTSLRSNSVTEQDLPSILIEEFADMARGLLANVALASIAAVRNDTHHLLGRFHPGLDGPYLSHRILSTYPDDAEDFAVRLVGAELTALLKRRTIGADFADARAFRLALERWTSNGLAPRLMKEVNNPNKTTRTLTVDEVMKLVQFGPEGLRCIAGVSNDRDKLHLRCSLLANGDYSDSEIAHREFAGLSSQARQCRLEPNDTQVKLDLGSIVCTEGKYLLCIQPRCDAIRLSASTEFLFARLDSGGNGSFELAVHHPEDGYVELSLDKKAVKTLKYKFIPDSKTGTVLCSEGGIFKSAGRKSFIWICDLRDAVAQGFVDRIATDLSRVAQDDFEWQRRHNPR